MNIISETSQVEGDPNVHQQSTPSYDRTRKNRRGKGAAHRSAEKSRKHLNMRTDAQLQARFDEIRNCPIPDCLKPAIPRTIEARPKQVDASYHILPKLVERTAAAVFENLSIPELEREQVRDALQLVTSIQLETKVYYSRMNAPFAQPFELAPRYRRKMVENSSMFTQNFKPIVNFLDSVGRFTFDGQDFYVKMPIDNQVYTRRFPTLRSFSMKECENIPTWFRQSEPRIDEPFTFRTNNFDMNGRELQWTATNRTNAVAAGLLSEEGSLRITDFTNPLFGVHGSFRPVVPIDSDPQQNGYQAYETLCDFMNRNYKKLDSVMASIDLTVKEGCVSQLVGCETLDQKNRLAWACRKIDGANLLLGCAMEFGKDGEGVHSYDAASVEANVCTDGVLDRLVNDMFAK